MTWLVNGLGWVSHFVVLGRDPNDPTSLPARKGLVSKLKRRRKGGGLTCNVPIGGDLAFGCEWGSRCAVGGLRVCLDDKRRGVGVGDRLQANVRASSL